MEKSQVSKYKQHEERGLWFSPEAPPRRGLESRARRAGCVGARGFSWGALTSRGTACRLLSPLICTPVCACAHTCTRPHMPTHVHTPSQVHTGAHPHTRIHMGTYIPTRPQARTRVHIPPYLHTYAHTCVHTHPHTCTQAHTFSLSGVQGSVRKVSYA